MSSITKIPVHNDGLSKLCIDNNSQIISTGNGSSVVLYNGTLDGDSYQFDVDQVDCIRGVACYHRDKHYVAIATDKHTVVEYSYASSNPMDDPYAESCMERTLMRFTADVNCVTASNDSKYLAAGASDFLIKVVDLDNVGSLVMLEGHEAPVMWVELTDNRLASSSCDGTVRVWSIEEKSQIASITVMPGTNEISLCPTLCRGAWDPANASALAVPTGDSVCVYGGKDWSLKHTLKDEYHEASINVCCWSTCGGYIAVGGADGRVTVWGYPSAKLLAKINTEVNLISSMQWVPMATDSAHPPLVFSTCTGHVGSIPGHMTRGGCGTDVAGGEDDPMIDDSLLMEGIPTDSIFEDADDILNASGIDHTHRKRPLSPSSEAPPTSRSRSIFNPVADSDHDSITDTHDLSQTPPTLAPPITKGTTLAPPPIQATPPPVQEYHEIFQPSATPTHLSHRFMVYNIIGMVRCLDDYSSTPMIEVEFHNTATHHSFSINNDVGWTMAAMNDKGLILGTEKNENGPSLFQVTVFDSWDADKDWTHTMPKGESIDVVAIGDSWVAVATDKQFIRMYSLGGVQCEIISSPGVVITMSGCGSHLGVVYQETEVSLLSFWQLNILTRKQVTSSHTLPLSPKAKLEWVGFSDSALPLSCDSKGVVRILSNQYGRSSWLPVLDCHKALAVKGDHYFVVGMTHDPNLLRVILCKGLDYPAVHPRPVMTTLHLSLPLCEPDTEKTEIESQYLQKLFIQPSGKPERFELLQNLMEMLALACQSNLEYRGYEVATMIQDEEGLELAFQYASKSGHYKLARQISSLKDQRTMDAYSDEESSDPVMDYPRHTYTNRDSTLSSTRLHRLPIRSSAIKTSSSRSTSNPLVKRSLSHPTTPSYDDENISDNCGDNMDSIVKENEDGEGGEEGESEGEEEEGEDRENNSLNSNTVDLFSSPQPSADSLTIKNNPFKIATPVSKQIQVDRRSSFLDKLCKTVVEEEEEKKKKKERLSSKGDSSFKKKAATKSKKTKPTNTAGTLSSFVYNKNK